MGWERLETDLVRRLHGGREGCAWYMVERMVAPGWGWEVRLRLQGGGREFAPSTWGSVIKRDFAIFCTPARGAPGASRRTGRTFRCC